MCEEPFPPVGQVQATCNAMLQLPQIIAETEPNRRLHLLIILRRGFRVLEES